MLPGYLQTVSILTDVFVVNADKITEGGTIRHRQSSHFDNGSDVFLTLRRPPKPPTPGLPGPPRWASDHVQFPVMLSRKMASETTFFNQTNNQTSPFNLPFRAGFDSSV